MRGARRSPNLTRLYPSIPKQMGNWWEKANIAPISLLIMPRKSPKTRQKKAAFPVEHFWEDLAPTWEGDLGEEKLGADHAGRFANAAMLTRGQPLETKLRHGDIPRETIRRLVSLLEVDDPEPLTDQLWALAGRHVRPVHALLHGSDPDSTRAVLHNVIKAAQSLEALLEDLPLFVSSFLEEFHASLPEEERQLPAINLQDLDRSLGDLAMLCARASIELHRRPNAPVRVLRRNTLQKVVATIESLPGRHVQTRWSRADKKCAEFKGREGNVVRIFMRLVEPGASEGVLVRLLRELRAEQRKRQNTPKG